MSEFTDYEDLLKIYYNGQMVQDLTNTDNPGLAMTARKKLAGQSMPLPVIETYGQGVSSDFATSKARMTNGNPEKFNLVADTLYQVVNIDRLTWKSSIGSNASFLDYMKYKIDGGLQGVGNALAYYEYGSGTGVLAQISTISTGVITLADVDTVTRFEVGMVLQASSSNDGSTGANLRAGRGNILSIDYAAGTITVAVFTPPSTFGSSAGSPSGWANGDFLLLDGTANAVGPGLDGWIPLSAPATVAAGGTAFLGVDRGVDPSRLAGSRYDGSASGAPADEVLMTGSSILGRMGQKPDAAWVSTDVYLQLQKISQGRVVYIETQIGGIGFEGIRVNGAKGPIAVYQDRSIPSQRGWLVTTKHLGLYSVGPAPELQVDDFGRLLRNSDSDGYQAVISAYYTFGIDAPVAFAALKFSAN